MDPISKFLAFFTALALMAGGAGFSEELRELPVLSIDDCVRASLANNPKLKEAVSNVDFNRAMAAVAKSAYLPQASTNLGYTHYDTSKITLGPGSEALASTSGFAKRYNVAAESTGVEQLIWDFGKTLNSIKLAKENLTSAQCAFLEAQENTVLRAKTAYYDVLKAQLMLEVAREGLRQSQVHLERAEGFFEVGYRQKYDVTKAEVAVSNAKLDLVSAEKDYKLAKAALNNVMGNKDSADFAVEEIRGIEFADVDADMSLKTAMENRVELLKLQSQARAAQADLEVKKKGNWPTVTAGGAHQVSDTDTDGVGNVKSWNAGVSVNFPWFDGFRTKSQVEAAQASLKMAQYAIEDQALGITLQVQDAILGLREAKERFDVSEKLLQQSSENLEIASARYEEGLGSIIEVTDAETQLVSAKQSRASAISGYLSSRAKYDKSVGIISQSVK
ncbi:MAG TPA: TolC family protein [Candidatus Omnitrophota bacterium]|nr:TolC family protein [Candidatus Omnitrophota bacterium]HPN66375.1 TolC family protein [Candidatus Omnitrophota bacterium]